MCSNMKEGLAVVARKKIIAEDVAGTRHDGDKYSGNADDLHCPVLQHDCHKQLFIAAETCGMHADRKIDDAYQSNRVHAEPLNRRIRHPLKR